MGGGGRARPSNGTARRRRHPPEQPLAWSWIQPVTSVSAGPPSGGLYLKPPSSGGLWDGVTTIPSARPGAAAVVGQDRVRETGRRGVAIAASTRTSTPFATRTSSAVWKAGSDRACVSRPTNSGPSCPAPAVPADRLGQRHDVRLVEGAVAATTRGGRTSRTRRAGRDGRVRGCRGTRR